MNYHLIKDWKYHAASLMVLISFGAKQLDVRHAYKNDKLNRCGRIFIIYLLLLVIYMFIIPDTIPYIAFFYLGLCLLDFYIGISLCTKKINQKNVALLLKEDKDIS